MDQIEKIPELGGPGKAPVNTARAIVGQMAAAKINPMKLAAQPWTEGYVLDYHTVSSTPTGDPYYRFDTKRTEPGELLFRLKYRGGWVPHFSRSLREVGKIIPPVSLSSLERHSRLP